MTGADFITALHEAGHSCFAVMSGMDVRYAALHRLGARQDEAGRVELHDMAGERDADMVRFLVFMLCGGAAERRATGRYSERDASDREYASALASAIVEREPTAPAVRTLVDNAQALAHAAMLDDRFWGWVERTARALVKRRRLTHRDIVELREAR